MKILNSQKGSALLQVLVVSVIIATIAVFLLRLSISRSSTVVKSTDVIVARTAVQDCIDEINTVLTCADIPDSINTYITGLCGTAIMTERKGRLIGSTKTNLFASVGTPGKSTGTYTCATDSDSPQQVIVTWSGDELQFAMNDPSGLASLWGN